MPPIIYESSLTLVQNVKVMKRIGSLCMFQIFSIFVTTAWLFLPELLFPRLDMLPRVSMAMLLQLNDYVGTLEPQVQMVIKDFDNVEESQSFLAFSSIFKNCILIFLLVNMLSETKPREGTNVPLYVIYEFLMPILITLFICIPTTLVIKK